MFWKKKVETKQVKCKECKHYVDKYDAQKVNDNGSEIYYCLMHKKNYDGIEYRPTICTEGKCKNPDIYHHWHTKTVYYKIIPEHKQDVKP